MHCYAFIMLYLKDGPLRSSNYFQLFLCLMYALKYFAGNIERQGGKGGGEPGVGEEEEDEGGNFKFLFLFCKCKYCKYN